MFKVGLFSFIFVVHSLRKKKDEFVRKFNSINNLDGT